MQFYNKIFIAILLVLINQLPANADTVWPVLYIVDGLISIDVIIAGLIIEIVFVKFFTDIRWVRAIWVSFLMNLATCIIGVLAIIIGGFFIEILFAVIGNPTSTFHWTHWLATYFLVIAINTLIETGIVSILLHIEFKKNIWWLLIANILSVTLCIMFHGSYGNFPNL